MTTIRTTTAAGRREDAMPMTTIRRVVRHPEEEA
jgi:hypothetical protein